MNIESIWGHKGHSKNNMFWWRVSCSKLKKCTGRSHSYHSFDRCLDSHYEALFDCVKIAAITGFDCYKFENLIEAKKVNVQWFGLFLEHLSSKKAVLYENIRTYKIENNFVIIFHN